LNEVIILLGEVKNDLRPESENMNDHFTFNYSHMWGYESEIQCVYETFKNVQKLSDLGLKKPLEHIWNRSRRTELGQQNSNNRTRRTQTSFIEIMPDLPHAILYIPVEDSELLGMVSRIRTALGCERRTQREDVFPRIHLYSTECRVPPGTANWIQEIFGAGRIRMVREALNFVRFTHASVSEAAARTDPDVTDLDYRRRPGDHHYTRVAMCLNGVACDGEDLLPTEAGLRLQLTCATAYISCGEDARAAAEARFRAAVVTGWFPFLTCVEDTELCVLGPYRHCVRGSEDEDEDPDLNPYPCPCPDVL
jgi:hypothetical protein